MVVMVVMVMQVVIIRSLCGGSGSSDGGNYIMHCILHDTA